MLHNSSQKTDTLNSSHKNKYKNTARCKRVCKTLKADPKLHQCFKKSNKNCRDENFFPEKNDSWTNNIFSTG